MEKINRRDLVKAFILVDYTYDFVAEEGKLTVGEPGQAIEKAIAEKIQLASECGDFIFVINDLHDEKDVHHPEHKLFPPHNLEGSEGRNLYGSIHELINRLEKDHPDQIHRLDKRRYSAFCGTPLELILRQEGVELIELAGVCTDICVLHTAVDAYNRGFKVVIHENAVASFNADAHKVALEHFENVLGFEVLKSY